MKRKRWAMQPADRPKTTCSPVAGHMVFEALKAFLVYKKRMIGLNVKE